MKVDVNIVKNISKEFENSGSDELEFRFGTITPTGNYLSGIKFKHFNLLKNKLGIHLADYSEKKIIYYKNDVRNVNGSFEKKVRLKNYQFTTDNYDIRFSRSEETKLKNVDMTPKSDVVLKRIWTWNFDYYFVELSMYKDEYHCEVEFTNKNIKTADIFEPIKVLVNYIDTYQNLISVFNKFFDKRFKDLYFPINKPKNLKKRHIPLLKDDYVYYRKLDGVRYLFLCCYLGKYLINQSDYIIIDEKYSKNTNVFDVEYLEESINVFDILIHNGKDIRENTFEERQFYLKGVKINCEKVNVMKYSDDYENIKYDFDDTLVDGIIFTPKEAFYKNSCTYKFKPADKLTIDLFVENDDYLYSINSNGKLVRFRKYKPELFKFYEKKIVECKYNTEEEQFEPVRIRYDKLSPNHISVADDIFQDIMNPLDISELK